MKEENKIINKNIEIEHLLELPNCVAYVKKPKDLGEFESVKQYYSTVE